MPASKTALITGASSGIGKALALRFASAGYSLVLVARSEASLRQVAELCSKTSPRVHTIVCDLSERGAAQRIFDTVREKNAPIDVLVNNAGFALHGTFLTTHLDREEALLNLQIFSPLALIKLFLPAMVARRHGHLLTVASVYSFTSVPKQAVYSGCKAFLHNFLNALAQELVGTGVSSTIVYPGITTTEFRIRAGLREKKGRFSLSPEGVAEKAYRGMERKKAAVVPGWFNQAFVFLVKHLPEAWLPAIMQQINQLRGVSLPTGPKGSGHPTEG